MKAGLIFSFSLKAVKWCMDCLPRIVFKALGYNGKSKAVEGEIINQKDEVITVFKSNQLGWESLASAI